MRKDIILLKSRRRHVPAGELRMSQHRTKYVCREMPDTFSYQLFLEANWRQLKIHEHISSCEQVQDVNIVEHMDISIWSIFSSVNL